MDISIKRAYEPAEPTDGHRVLVDRLWPRGRSREELHLDEWARELAPSPELRRWFGHDPARWQEFRRRYREELRRPEASAALARLAERAASGRVTLVYGARDTEHNGALVLAELLRERSEDGSPKPEDQA
jgi:uncharacterized protein YeaO (DUF488 family)